MPPNDETASTISRPSCSRTILPISRAGLMVPDGVSWWTSETTLMSGRLRKASATWPGSIASLYGTSISTMSL